MPSPKTEPSRSWADRLGWPGVDPRGFGDLSKRLNARLVLALAVVTLVGLVTSGVAISQILPGYFIEQTRQRLETAVGATAVDLQQRVNEAPNSNTAMVAELRENQLDEDSLPPYPELDRVLEAYVELDQSREDLTSDGFDPEVVDRALGMIDRAEYKRRQAPPGVKLRPKAFGRDWRLPITNRWRG